MPETITSVTAVTRAAIGEATATGPLPLEIANAPAANAPPASATSRKMMPQAR